MKVKKDSSDQIDDSLIPKKVSYFSNKRSVLIIYV